MTDQASRLRNLVDTHTDNKKIYAVTSGKGGVGKTNLAVNLALAFHLAGKSVLLVDADIGMANVNVLLGNITNRSLVELKNPRIGLWDVVEETKSGLKYISGVANIDTILKATDKDLEMILRKLTSPSNFADIIVIDTGAGLNKLVLEFIIAAQEVLLITTSEPTALADAYEVVKAYDQYGQHKNIRLIVNRIRDLDEWKDTADRLNQTTQKFLNVFVEPLGYIYEDRAVWDAVRRQEPFLTKTPDSPASRCIKELARSLIYGAKMKNVSRGWRNWFSGIFN